jgi:hypothetical protein
MSAAVITPAQVHGIALCMQHWCSASEEALDQAHNPHRSSASRVESLRFSSRAETRAERLSNLLRAASTERFVREAA